MRTLMLKMTQFRNMFKNLPQAENKECLFLQMLKIGRRTAIKYRENLTFDFAKQAIAMHFDKSGRCWRQPFKDL